MYHPYQQGYNVLPKLNKTDGPFFQVTEDRDRFLFEKAHAQQSQICFAEHEMTDEIYAAACQFILDRYPLELQPPHTFHNLVTQLQEDMVIHRVEDDRDWVAAVSVCLPFGWRPDKQVGYTFDEIHRPVPGMNLNSSRKMVEAMVHHGPFERFVWAILYEWCINLHPDRPRKLFDPKAPEVWVKVERQLIYGLPECNAALFILRQHLIPESEIDKPALVKALSEMSEEHKEYKGLTNIEPLLEYLGGSCVSV